jgi:hypothetical protein
MQSNFSTFVIFIAILSALLGAIIGKIDRDKALERKVTTTLIKPANEKMIDFDKES